ncbi:MAG TPA: adenylate/guanylate cyclase domain-containing protein [Candidatus Polarisedimenticolia bacterium]|nr:adenylate/guanylate cyclase domain-containing protein [Candidatus Polarisedimenticolia bacterium]
MPEPLLPGEMSEEFWRDYLTNGDPRERRMRKFYARIPSSPRCKACAAPFGGYGGHAMRFIGRRPSSQNPGLCNACFDFMREHRGGAEIRVTMLFADVRGSTRLAETMSATEFHKLLARFYRVATEAVFSNGGGVDKFVGDELVAMFYPIMAGDEHPSAAIEAARQLMRVTGNVGSDKPWLPIGAGVHTGQAWVGAIGDETHVELTALGDAVNVASRLASVAKAGEIIVSLESAREAHLDLDMPHESLDLKGRQDPIDVIRLTLASEAGAAA